MSYFKIVDGNKNSNELEFKITNKVGEYILPYSIINGIRRILLKLVI